MWPWALGLFGFLAFVTMLGMFVRAVRSAAVERKRRREVEGNIERMTDARALHDMADVDPDRVDDFWDGMRDDG